MKTNRLIVKALLAVVLSAATVLPSFAAGEENSFTTDQVTVASDKSFEQASDAIRSLVAKNGMMVMAEVDQGKMLSMTGLSLKATLYLIGNPTVGKQLFEQNHGVGLYIPLRVFVYSDQNGKTRISFDKPSTLLSQFHSEKITMIGQMLDQKLDGLATMAAE